ncbi:MAG: 23S rRNA (uracil(1939)-C(5))-methyltransferase RlmD [Firmicutes bacterium]|nr:23S rRNA (uracil(1939)-C(5))-methyltransferase RlmD [Bacillota bacterium]
MREYKGLYIESVTNMGAGAAVLSDGKDKGKRIFVWGAVDGDTVDVRLTKEHSSYAEGEIARLVSPSPYRMSPDCEYFSQGCGGCMFRQMTYEHELDVKKGFVESAFRRERLNIEVGDTVPSAEMECSTRSKITVSVNEYGKSGYYLRATHKTLSCERCLLHSAELDEIRAYAAANAKNRGIDIQRLSIREAERGISVTFELRRESLDAGKLRKLGTDLTVRFPRVTCVYTMYTSGGREIYRHICGEEYIVDEMGGCEFMISPGSFYQVNRKTACALYDLAADFAALSDGESVADLYCGTGTIGLYAARRLFERSGGRVKLTGAEVIPDAVENAKANAERNGVPAEFYVMRAEEFDGAADIVFLDPPRSGCGSDLISHLCRVRPDRVVYVSCNPSTLARDVKAFCGGGYEVCRAVPIDMFPRTGHVETIVLMSR